MKSPTLRCIFQQAVLLGVLANASVVLATTVIRLNLRALVDEADLVFVGTPLRQEVVPTRDGKFPFTFVTFSVEQVFKGLTKDRPLTLRLAGGQLGKRTVEVIGMPEFKLGERYLLFVSQNGQAGCPLLGWGQGVLEFTPDTRTGITVMIDEFGAPVLGIQHDDWVRGAPKFPPKPGLIYSEVPASQSQQDLRTTPPTATIGAQAKQSTSQRELPELVDANRVLAELRAFIASRRGKPGFLSAPPVRSALTTEVPDGMRGRSVSSGRVNEAPEKSTTSKK